MIKLTTEDAVHLIDEIMLRNEEENRICNRQIRKIQLLETELGKLQNENDQLNVVVDASDRILKDRQRFIQRVFEFFKRAGKTIVDFGSIEEKDQYQALMPHFDVLNEIRDLTPLERQELENLSQPHSKTDRIRILLNELETLGINEFENNTQGKINFEDCLKDIRRILKVTNQ